MQKNTKLIFAASLGTFLEFYDFVIFAVLTPIIAPLFFPASDPLSQILSGYAAFAMSFLMRPLGGMVFSSVGDRYGRSVAVMGSMGLMGIATLIIACLPTYSMIGFWAPLLLIFCRLLQGFSAGGEYSGAALMIVESAPKPKLFRQTAFVPMAAVVAVLVGSQTTQIWALDGSSFWGWRIPFFIGAGVAAVALMLRNQLSQELEQPKSKSKESLWQSQYAFPLVQMTLLAGLGVMIYYTFAAYLVSFLTLEAGWGKADAYGVSSMISLGAFLLMYPISWLADQILNPWQLIKYACLTLAVTAIPLFYLLSWGNSSVVYALVPLMAVIFAVFVLTNALTAKLFGTAVRFRAMALTYTLGASVFGGTAPLIYTSLLKHFELAIAPGIYLAAIAFLGFLVAQAHPKDLSASSKS